MSKKITWDVIKDDFKKNHPNLDKRVSCWRPYDFATILLYFKNGDKATYNYDTKELKFIAE